MKKRLIAVLMCAAMVTVLGAGCGSKKEDTKETSDAKNIIASNKNKKYQFVTPEKAAAISSLLDKIRLEGEEEERYDEMGRIDE